MEKIQWYPGHMAKALREIKNNLKLVDLLIEVTDARIPFSSSNPDLRNLSPDKPHLILLNKADLADPALTANWQNFWQKRGLTPLAVDAKHKQGFAELYKIIETLKKNVSEKKKGRLNYTFRLMIVGIPNTGKSSVLNCIGKGSLSKTGDKPGITRGKQWVTTGAGWEILDTPGVMWPKQISEHSSFLLAVTGSISEKLISQEALALELIEILRRFYPESLAKIINERINAVPEDQYVILEKFALLRGCIQKKGAADINRAAELLLKEFRHGKLGRFTLEQPVPDAGDWKQGAGSWPGL